MKVAGGVIGLLIVLAITWFVIKSQYAGGPTGGKPPAETIDVVGVKADLLVIAQAERLYLAAHGSYASLGDLQQEGSLSFSGSGRRGYRYNAEVDDGLRFKIRFRRRSSKTRCQVRGARYQVSARTENREPAPGVRD